MKFVRVCCGFRFSVGHISYTLRCRPGSTHNTFLDALCKGGQMDLAMQVMSEMLAKKILPNLMTYSTIVDCMYFLF